MLDRLQACRHMLIKFICFAAIGAVQLTGMLTPSWAGSWRVETARQLEQRLQLAVASEVRRCSDPRFDLHAALAGFYRYRGFEPAWVDRYGLRPEGAMALSAVSQAEGQGLRYADYQDPWLDDLLDGMLTRPVIIGSAFRGQADPARSGGYHDGLAVRLALHRGTHCCRYVGD